MIFDGRTYSVLVVSSAEKFNKSIPSLLPGGSFYPVHTVGSIASAKRALMDQPYDFVIINSPLPDDVGSHFAMDTCNEKGAVTLILLKNELFEDLNFNLTNQGVFTLAKPISAQIFNQALDWMITTRERLRVAEGKTLTIEEKMDEIRLINHSKWLLIEKGNLSEDDAHRKLGKLAMDRGLTKKEVAKQIIAQYE